VTLLVYVPFTITTEQDMDGEAIVEAFATCSGPDCLKDVISKYGQRVKVYHSIKVALGECYRQVVSCMVQKLTLIYTDSVFTGALVILIIVN